MKVDGSKGSKWTVLKMYPEFQSKRQLIESKLGTLVFFIELNKRSKHSGLEFLILSGFYLEHFCQDFFRIVRIFFRKLILANPDNFVRIFVYGLTDTSNVLDYYF